MTLAEAMAEYSELGENHSNSGKVCNLIHKIFKEFETANCGTCKHWKSTELSAIKYISYCSKLDIGTKETFYCNKYMLKI